MATYSLAELSRSGIYQIVNTVNGKRYIGSAKSFKVRWAKHLGDLKLGRHHSAYLQRSWLAHGAEQFVFEVLEYCEVAALIAREQAWMDSIRPQYNVSPTAGNCTGVKHSEATRLKHSVSRLGKKASPEVVAKRTGQKRTEEQRARFSAAQKAAFQALSPDEKKRRAERIAETNRATLSGRKQSPEEIARRAATLIGRVVTEETRRKISQANRGRPPSPAAIAASIAATKGVKKSEEFRQKCRDRKATEETRQRMSEASKGRMLSEESREKIAASKRGRKLSPDAIAKRTATRRANGNYAVSDVTREKLSHAGRGRVRPEVSQEARDRMSAAKVGKKWTEAQRAGQLRARKERALREQQA